MATESPANGVSTTLSAAITNTATSLPLTSATGFPNGQYTCLLSDGTNAELVEASALSGTTLTVTRASEAWGGSATAYAFGTGTKVTIVTSVGSVERLITSNAVPLSTVTTAGDLIVGTGAGAVGRLGVGTSSQVLLGGTTPTWGSPPASALTYAVATLSTSLNIAASTQTTFVTSPSLATGYYILLSQLDLYPQANTTAQEEFYMAITAGTATFSFVGPSNYPHGQFPNGTPAAGGNTTISFNTIINITAAGTINAQAWCAVAAAVNATSSGMSFIKIA